MKKHSNTTSSKLKRHRCSVAGCNKLSVAYCIFAGDEKGTTKWKGFVCESCFGVMHTKYVAIVPGG